MMSVAQIVKSLKDLPKSVEDLILEYHKEMYLHELKKQMNICMEAIEDYEEELSSLMWEGTRLNANFFEINQQVNKVYECLARCKEEYRLFSFEFDWYF